MKRLPDSRISDALKSAARPFVDHSVQGLKTSASIEVVYPSATFRDRAVLLASGQNGTRAKDIVWNAKEHKGDCLHCGDPLTARGALPVCKYKVDDKFWVFGQFCSPSCGLGFLREHNETPQVFAWTRQMFQNVFDIQSTPVAPPRFMLKRYGGTLEKEIWMQHDFIATKMAPLSTFAMFAEVEQKPSVVSVDDLQNLKRPTVRQTMPAGPTSTGREPVLLKVLAEDSSQTLTAEPKRKQTTKKTRVSTSLNAFLSDES